MIVNLKKKDFCNRFRTLNLQTESDLEFLMLVNGDSLQKCIVMTISCHEIISSILVSTSSFCFHSYFGGPIDLIVFCGYSNKWLDFLHFIFPFLNDLKKILDFLDFKVMITLWVVCLIINIFFSKWHIL